MTARTRLAALVLFALSAAASAPAQQAAPRQPRLKQDKPEGRREKLALGTLFLPAALKLEDEVPLVIHFHGSSWLPEVAAARYGRAAVIGIQLGSGSRSGCLHLGQSTRMRR